MNLKRISISKRDFPLALENSLSWKYCHISAQIENSLITLSLFNYKNNCERFLWGAFTFKINLAWINDMKYDPMICSLFASKGSFWVVTTESDLAIIYVVFTIRLLDSQQQHYLMSTRIMFNKISQHIISEKLLHWTRQQHHLKIKGISKYENSVPTNKGYICRIYVIK